MDTTTTETQPIFELHRHRGPFNAAFFRMLGPVIEKSMHEQKVRVFTDLPREVVEIGPGVGANLGYLPTGANLIAIEPNLYMHEQLKAEAAKRGVKLDLRASTAEHTGLPDHSVDAVISSLVLCTVRDPQAVLVEIQRILRPGGTYRFAEHVVAPRGASRAPRSGSSAGRGRGPSKDARARETLSRRFGGQVLPASRWSATGSTLPSSLSTLTSPGSHEFNGANVRT